MQRVGRTSGRRGGGGGRDWSINVQRVGRTSGRRGGGRWERLEHECTEGGETLGKHRVVGVIHWNLGFFNNLPYLQMTNTTVVYCGRSG